MNGFLIFPDSAAAEQFLCSEAVLSIADRLDLKTSSTQPVITFRGANDAQLEALRKIAEELGGRIEPARRYAPVIDA